MQCFSLTMSMKSSWLLGEYFRPPYLNERAKFNSHIFAATKSKGKLTNKSRATDHDAVTAHIFRYTCTNII